MWTREKIENLVRSNDVAAMRGVCALFRNQTEHEKQVEDVVTKNFKGFSVATVKAGSEMADWMTMGKSDGVYRRSVGGGMKYGTWPDSKRPRYWKRIEVCREICLQHVGQLTKIANGDK